METIRGVDQGASGASMDTLVVNGAVNGAGLKIVMKNGKNEGAKKWKTKNDKNEQTEKTSLVTFANNCLLLQIYWNFHISCKVLPKRFVGHSVCQTQNRSGRPLHFSCPTPLETMRHYSSSFLSFIYGTENNRFYRFRAGKRLNSVHTFIINFS